VVHPAGAQLAGGDGSIAQRASTTAAMPRSGSQGVRGRRAGEWRTLPRRVRAFQIVLELLQRSLEDDPRRWTNIAASPPPKKKKKKEIKVVPGDNTDASL